MLGIIALAAAVIGAVIVALRGLGDFALSAANPVGPASRAGAAACLRL